MDIREIAKNISIMLSYRLNSAHHNFNIVFEEFTERPKQIKVEYEIDQPEVTLLKYIVRYSIDKKIYKTAYVNFDLNFIKNNLDNDEYIIVYDHVSLQRKINQMIKKNDNISCEFFTINELMINYQKNIYFVNCYKSKEKNIKEKIQYISSTDFNVRYLNLKPGDYMMINNIIDSTLYFPQIREVKLINTVIDEQIYIQFIY